MNEIMSRLIISMKAFLFFEAYAPSNLDASNPINQVKMNGEALDSALVSIALKKWEIHLGYKLKIGSCKNNSIQELVNKAQKLSTEEYQANVSQRMEEIAELLHQYVEQSNSEHGAQEKAEYLLNLN